MSLNSDVLPAGLPALSSYKSLLKTPLFRDMEVFSDSFVRLNNRALMGYEWSPDPFHQWSRQWEYPFACSKIAAFQSSLRRTSEAVTILDAGSGVTFFPFYLVSKFNVTLKCCDIDSKLANIFEEIKRQPEFQYHNLDFVHCDLQKTPFENDSFDIVYCISVLEHLRTVDGCLKEFNRILRPDGLLVVTFDVSRDNRNDLRVEEAERVLSLLETHFDPGETSNIDLLHANLEQADFLSLRHARDFDVKLMPHGPQPTLLWKARMRLMPKMMIPNLTVFCESWKKRGRSD